MIQGTKVVTNEEMRRLEKLSSADGLNSEKLGWTGLLRRCWLL